MGGELGRKTTNHSYVNCTGNLQTGRKEWPVLQNNSKTLIFLVETTEITEENDPICIRLWWLPCSDRIIMNSPNCSSGDDRFQFKCKLDTLDYTSSFYIINQDYHYPVLDLVISQEIENIATTISFHIPPEVFGSCSIDLIQKSRQSMSELS